MPVIGSQIVNKGAILEDTVSDISKYFYYLITRS